MSYDADMAMQEMYRDALMEQTVRHLQTDSDWRRFRAISGEAKKQRDQENQSYKDDYGLRVSKKIEELQRKAGSKTYEHPTPAGVDQFAPGRLHREAQRLVRHEHRQRLYAILNDEVAGYEALSEDIRARDRVRNHARDEFTRVVDRRNGPDRRMPSRD